MDAAFVDGRPVARDDVLESRLVRLRQVLNAREQAAMAALGADAARVVGEVMTGISRGDTERAVAGRVRAALAEASVESPVVLVAADDRIGRYRHPLPRRNPIARSAMVVVVAERAGLHVALTRMGWIGGGPSADVERRSRVAWSIFDAFTAATVPGRALSDVFAAGARAYQEQGFGDEWQLHHQGGTSGYRPREVLATRAASETIVSVGMAFAWNPSVTGTKAEDTFIVTEAGPRIVTVDPAWPRDPDGHPAVLYREDRPPAGAPVRSQSSAKES